MSRSSLVFKPAARKRILSAFLLLSLLEVGLFSSMISSAKAQAGQSHPESRGSQKVAARIDFDQSYSQYGRDLEKFVEGETGLVHYRRWQVQRADLDVFIDSLAALDPAQYEKWSRDQRLAFWLNTYNALAIKAVLDHYPIKKTVDYFPENSIRQFNDGWEVLKFTVMGQPITLYDIEHDRLRRGFCDPRVHFAVASASMDSALISKRPFIADGLDQRLDHLARQFFAQKNTFHFDPSQCIVRVSKIFSWFTLDFAVRACNGKVPFPPPSEQDIALDFAQLYLPKERVEALKKCRSSGTVTFDYLPYDWSLNDAK